MIFSHVLYQLSYLGMRRRDCPDSVCAVSRSGVDLRLIEGRPGPVQCRVGRPVVFEFTVLF